MGFISGNCVCTNSDLYVWVAPCGVFWRLIQTLEDLVISGCSYGVEYPFQQYFSYIVAVSLIGGWRKPEHPE